MSDFTWSTDDELLFLSRLYGKRDKLEGYLLGCSRRAVWGQIEAAVVRAKAEEFLAKALEGGS